MYLPFYLLPFLWYGITFSLTSSTLLERPRDYLTARSRFLFQLLNCPFCTGFHAGWVAYLLNNPWKGYSFLSALIEALASAGFCYFLDNFILGIERYRDVSIRPPDIEHNTSHHQRS